MSDPLHWMGLQAAHGIEPNLEALAEIPDDWWAELKYDGMRAKVFKTEDGEVGLESRSRKSQLGKCPHLEAALENLPDGTVLDGEFVLIPEDWSAGSINFERPGGGLGTIPLPIFNKTMRIMGSKPGEAVRKQDEFGKITLVLFDVLAFGGDSLIDKSQAFRRYVLEDAVMHLFAGNDHIIKAAIMKPTEHLIQQLLEQDGEGLMLKNPEAIYEPEKRSRNWLKYKFVHDADVVITGFTEAQYGLTGKFDGLIGAVKFGQYVEGTEWRDEDEERDVLILTERGQTSGMTDEVRRDMTANQQDYIGKVMVIKHMGIAKDGFRHPQFKCFRDDKSPEECTWDS